MARKPAWKPTPDPESDLDMALYNLRMLAEMLVEIGAKSHPERTDFLVELLPGFVGDAQRAYDELHPVLHPKISADVQH